MLLGLQLYQEETPTQVFSCASCLNISRHLQSKTSKCYKIIGLIKKLSIHLLREALLRIYKSFVRPNLDYCDIIFDKPIKTRIESIQYKACIAITEAIQGTSMERLYRELGLESLSDRCCFRKLTFFYKIVLRFVFLISH